MTPPTPDLRRSRAGGRKAISHQRIGFGAAVIATVVACLLAGAAGTAEGGEPLVRATPSWLRFESTELGHAEEQTVTLTNHSRKAREIRFHSQPPDGPFSHGDSSCAHGLQPHGSCEVTVWFRPEHWGASSGVLLYQVGDSPLETYQVRLSGEVHQTG